MPHICLTLVEKLICDLYHLSDVTSDVDLLVLVANTYPVCNRVVAEPQTWALVLSLEIVTNDLLMTINSR